MTYLQLSDKYNTMLIDFPEIIRKFGDYNIELFIYGRGHILEYSDKQLRDNNYEQIITWVESN